MGAVRARAWSLVRRRVAATLLLAALVGLAGAVSLAALAGARRGERALPEFLAQQDPPEGVFFAFSEPGDDLADGAAALRELDYVEDAVRVVPLLLAGPDAGGAPRRFLAFDVLDAGGEDVLGDPIVVDGRLPDAARADEIAVDEEFVDRTGVGVGETYLLRTYTGARTGDTDPNGPPPDGPEAEVRVVGVLRYPGDLIPARLEQDAAAVDTTDVLLTPAFFERHGPDLASLFGVGVAVRLEGGEADLGRLEEDANRLFQGGGVDPVDPDRGVKGLSIDGVRRAIDLEARALQGFGLVAAVAGLVIVGQALSRQAAADATDDAVLDAMGMTRAQRVAAATLRAAVPAAAGAVLAVLGAVALSPLTPIGVARRAELDRGLDVDATVLVLGALAVLLLVCAWAAVSAWRATTAATRVADAPPARTSSLGRLLSGTRLPVAGWTGLQMAVQRGRTGTVGLRRAAVGVAGVTVVVVTAAAAFAASLDALGREPKDYGVTWDASVGQPGTPDKAFAVEEALRREDGVAAFTGFTGEGLVVGDEEEEVPAMVVFRGSVGPRVVEGRAPRGADEIAFAGRTLEDLGIAVGDRIDVTLEFTRSLLVTGEVLLNGAGLLDDIEEGEGALLPDPAQQQLVDPEFQEESYPGGYLVRFEPGVDRDAVLARLDAAFPRTVVRPLPPTQVDNIDRVAGLPALLAALVAVLGIGTIVHATVTTVRRRRRDLAMLTGMGFVRRQVSSALAWQATAVAGVALVVGLPLGVAVGRWAWRLTADALWVVAPPEVPFLAVVLVTVAALVVVNAAALGAGLLVRAGTPAAALRAE